MGKLHYLYAWSLLWFEWNFKGAGKRVSGSQTLYPNYSWTDYHLALGHYEDAYQGAIKNIDYDPKNDVAWTGVITSSYFANHDPDKVIRKALVTPVIRIIFSFALNQLAFYVSEKNMMKLFPY